MTAKEAKIKLQRIAKAMKSFPKEVRRQERAHRQEMKVRNAFGKISLEPKRVKVSEKIVGMQDFKKAIRGKNSRLL